MYRSDHSRWAWDDHGQGANRDPQEGPRAEHPEGSPAPGALAGAARRDGRDVDRGAGAHGAQEGPAPARAARAPVQDPGGDSGPDARLLLGVEQRRGPEGLTGLRRDDDGDAS